MSNTARKTYSLPKEYADWVVAEAARLGTYESSIIRMALDLFIQQVPIDVSVLNEARIEARNEFSEALQRALRAVQEAWG